MAALGPTRWDPGSGHTRGQRGGSEGKEGRARRREGCLGDEPTGLSWEEGETGHPWGVGGGAQSEGSGQSRPRCARNRLLKVRALDNARCELGGLSPLRLQHPRLVLGPPHPPPSGGFPCGASAVGGLGAGVGGRGGEGVCLSNWSPGRQGSFQPLWTLPRPAAQGLGVGGTPKGRANGKGQQVPGSFPPRLREQPGRPQSPAGPPRWHLRARGSTAGQNRNFLGPSGRLRERGEDGHDPQSPPPAWCGLQLPACSTKPEAYNARRTPGVYGLRLQLPACSAELRLTTPY